MSDVWVVDEAYNIAGFEYASGHSTIGYVNRKRRGRCKANGDTCKGWHTADSPYCVGHKRAIAKTQKASTTAIEKSSGFADWLAKVSVA